MCSLKAEARPALLICSGGEYWKKGVHLHSTPHPQPEPQTRRPEGCPVLVTAERGFGQDFLAQKSWGPRRVGAQGAYATSHPNRGLPAGFRNQQIYFKNSKGLTKGNISEWKEVRNIRQQVVKKHLVHSLSSSSIWIRLCTLLNLWGEIYWPKDQIPFLDTQKDFHAHWS